MNDKEKLIAGLTKAWRDENASARNHRALAASEPNAERKSLLLRLAEAEVERERREIEQRPEEEREEMELLYQIKSFSPEEAKKMAAKLAEEPEHSLKTLAHEELGLSERTFPNPWKAATSATLSTAVGAFIPVIPYFFLRAQRRCSGHSSSARQRISRSARRRSLSRAGRGSRAGWRWRRSVSARR